MLLTNGGINPLRHSDHLNEIKRVARAWDFKAGNMEFVARFGEDPDLLQLAVTQDGKDVTTTDIDLGRDRRASDEGTSCSAGA